jgi:hypothetical protein
MADPRPNIIFIITDQQRYDTVGALGFPYMDTPNAVGACVKLATPVGLVNPSRRLKMRNRQLRSIHGT